MTSGKGCRTALHKQNSPYPFTQLFSFFLFIFFLKFWSIIEYLNIQEIMSVPTAKIQQIFIPDIFVQDIFVQK